MKLYKLLALFLFVFSFSAMAQKEVKTIEINVSGVCGMCETRIENALDVKGIKMADWSESTHMCSITYRADKISEEEIHQLLNAAGHDTETHKATDEQYSGVHSCCKYREDQDH